MKKLFTLIALSSCALVSADQYSQVNSGSENNLNNSLQSTNLQDPSEESTTPEDSSDSPYQIQKPQAQDNDEDVNEKGLTENKATDQELDKKIRVVLTTGPLAKSLRIMSVDSSDGKIVIKGTVDTVINKNKAEELIKTIEGVNSVDNKLEVENK